MRMTLTWRRHNMFLGFDACFPRWNGRRFRCRTCSPRFLLTCRLIYISDRNPTTCVPLTFVQDRKRRLDVVLRGPRFDSYI
jgi:hypothetical protein